MKPIKIILISFLSLFQFKIHASGQELKFIKNRNQQHPDVLYSAELNGGAVYLEHSAFTYVFYNAADMERIDKYIHDCEYLNPENNEPVLRGHAYKVHFKNANPNPAITETGKFKEYYNYFFGQDESKWAENVPLFSSIYYNNVYRRIDVKVYSEGNNPKYDFIVRPGADAADVVLNFEGTDGLAVEDGNLKIKTSVSTIVEQKPFAFQMIEGNEKNVPCQYSLNRNNVTFHFPKGYDSRYELVIDPVIVAATYSGTTYRAYAHTATYDNAGNIYSSGRAFSVNANGSGAGYPVTLGAFQTTHAGGYQDICVSKYNPDGSSLIWATYIGGSGQEQPHSLFVNANNQLYIYGTSNSPNYPVSATGYQRTNPTDNFGNHLNDIVVTKLNAAGSALIGSTYVGGRSENDGINWSTVERYYGDYFKGEIIIDSSDNAYVASYTRATDFPTTTGVIQPVYSGGYQDGVIFKLNSDLSSLVWSTFFGGPAEDACYGLKLDAAGNLFVTGAISSNILTNTSGTIHTSYIGGLFDAFVAHIRADGQAVIKSTYFGSVSEEQAYLLDLDKNGNVYIFGATPNSAIQSTPGAYQGVMNGSFIAKLKPTLDSVLFITTFNQLAPTALMVDECNYIYALGHGGLNTSIGNLSGFQTTSDAFQTGSGGFYMLALEPDATALKFGSYYGPQDSHVDGGTCRFDKRGIIYHALCTDKTTLFTTPTALHRTKLSNDFDNTVFKIDFQAARVYAYALATIAGSNDTSANVQSCNSNTVQFINHSVNAVQYIWYFSTGDSSTVAQPTYMFINGGSHIIMLIARDSLSCNKRDTAFVTVNTGSVALSASATNTSCNSNLGSASVVITSGTGPYNYLWSRGDTTSVITNLSSGNYTVTVTAGGNCSATASATVISSNGVTLSVTSTNTTCGNNNGSAVVTVSTGSSPFAYSWSNGAVISSPVNLPAGTYSVTVSDDNGCSATAGVTVNSSTAPSATIASNKFIMCSGDSAHICVNGAYTSYLWNTGQSGSCINTKLAGNYYVTVTDNNTCTAASNHIAINVYALPPVSISVNGDTLTAYNAVTYQWFLNNVTIPNATSNIYIAPQSGDYSVAVTDSNGCLATSTKVTVVKTATHILAREEEKTVNVFPNPFAEGCRLQVTGYRLNTDLYLEITDITGRKAGEQKIIASSTPLNLSHLERGIYFIRVQGEGVTVTKRIVKE